jgi:hypothetical protein
MISWVALRCSAQEMDARRAFVVGAFWIVVMTPRHAIAMSASSAQLAVKDVPKIRFLPLERLTRVPSSKLFARKGGRIY